MGGAWWLCPWRKQKPSDEFCMCDKELVNKDDTERPIIDGSTAEVALRLSSVTGLNSRSAGDGGVVLVLDASDGWRRNGSQATPYEAAAAHNSFFLQILRLCQHVYICPLLLD